MKTVSFIFLLAFLFITGAGNSQTTATFFKETDAFLKTYVSNGKIDYKSIHKNPEALDNLMQQAKGIVLTNENASSIQAFWINAYNLSVIKGIVDNYPIASPLDKKGFFDGVTYQLAGQNITLNDIENKQLRAIYKDPRFHFVLVCGALGCPPLINQAYVPALLEKQLETQTKKALNDPNFIKISGKKVAFSEIFKWYKEDFQADGDEIAFLNKYLTNQVPEKSKVTYYTYDWRLNAQ